MKHANYVMAVEDVLCIDPVRIKEEALPKGTVARCYPTERVIVIDESNVLDELELFQILAHELRHQYQYDAVCGVDLDESEILIKMWGDNFKRYMQATEEAHSFQPVELDAEAFSYVVMRTLFNVTIKNHEMLKNNLDYFQTLGQIERNWLADEIIECAEFAKFDYKRYAKK